MRSFKGRKNTLLDNIARLFGFYRHGAAGHHDYQDGEMVGRIDYGPDVTDEAVRAAILLVPRHHSAHNQRFYESQSPWQPSDIWAGSATEGSTTFGVNPLEYEFVTGQTLSSTIGSGTSGRTLTDPLNSAITWTMTLVKKTAVNLNVMGNIPWWLQANSGNFTQNGNFGIFSAVDQTLQLFSVPISKAIGSTYTAVHNSPVTVKAGAYGVPFRWCAVFSDGATVN